jgi:hypothetical protein
MAIIPTPDGWEYVPDAVTVVNLPHSPEILTPQKDMTGRKTLTEGLKILLNLPLPMPEKHALQAVDACHNIAKAVPQTLIATNYLPILQKVSANHGKGTWKIEEEELFFFPTETPSTDSGSDAKNA